ncbi:uncharacterized protein LOC103931357 isoform X1 [Pyrus x bretschneideri]|uniref:uncharacterized protein LOC103931357 isoform X1 n=1 Tax=Pyrus x bretschneideri TaxID=225117 RepID=UPI002030FCFC|nr:uncharacterized protein LOC103931357 isoform X1 [Pyrus x bretschneideri]XP_018499047.2 uncharacterized protein LOC103931357 isoform X1 [Pyrus x bretschneideri]XP_048445242.1 uncharacterized protein LOC103931357 isoform X1 [Pyrus x bretschneideri]XP_048445243.1 uncharacterized protein LOC103931357 isoform X1 [Pyrus x bretschneideri]
MLKRKSWFVNSRRVKLNSIVYGGLGSCCSMFTSNRRITSIQSITGDGLGCTYTFLIEYMLRLSRVRSDVIWLPFGPLSGVGLTVYVDHLLTNSSEEIRKLRGYVYAYKAI